MSKIALTPNPSGTGVFTISSPATSTDRTLTLPDITGTLVSTDASGNVGIGTTSPATLLNISSNSSVAPVVFTITDTDNAVPNGQVLGGINFETSDTTNAGVSAQIEAVYENASGATAIDFRTGYAGALVNTMHLDFVGRVGIGTSSPSAKLNLVGTGGVSKIRFDGDAANLQNNFIGITGYDDLIIASDEANSGTASTIQFRVDAAERMRIDSSGNVLVGTNDTTLYDNTVANVGGAAFIKDAYGTRLDVVRDNTCMTLNRPSTSGVTLGLHNRGVQVGSINCDSSSTSFNTSSDYRLKTDAQPMVGASDRVLALKPVNFEWISSGDRVDGFLAHEAQAVVPECVTGTKDAMRDEEYEVTAAVYEDIIIAAVLDEEGNELEAERTEQRLVTEAVMGTRSVPDMQGIDQSKLVPLLTAALQEALTEISALKVRVAALEAV